MLAKDLTLWLAESQPLHSCFFCDHTVINKFSHVTFYFPLVTVYVKFEHFQLHAACQMVCVKIYQTLEITVDLTNIGPGTFLPGH